MVKVKILSSCYDITGEDGYDVFQERMRGIEYNVRLMR